MYIKYLIMAAWIFFASGIAYAGSPMWTFTPLTPTSVTVNNNSSATVSYRITNQTKKTQRFVMKAIPGVTQVTTGLNCRNPFVLGYKQSCILNLLISGSTLNRNVSGGPIVCLQGNLNQCYQPAANNILRINKINKASYTVGGSILGLSGTVILQNNGSAALRINSNGSFTFSNPGMQGTPYNVTVLTQPIGQTCLVTNGTGTIVNARITNVSVNCSANASTVGGTLSGLSGTVELQNNGGDNLSLNSNGSFVFSTPVVQGAPYNVTVLTQPAGQTCTVGNGTGTINHANVTNVTVTCSVNAYTVGGTLSGLSGTVALQNNGGDNLNLNSDGPFTFSTPVAQGATYNVTVLTQPAGQTCTVTNGSGTMGGGNVTNVSISCLADSTTLSTSVSTLALSVTGLTEYGISGTPSSGLARIITITNTGNSTATNLSITPPTWPSGTTNNTNCSSTLTAGSTCTITVTPGNTATSDGTNPCSAGTPPVPGVIQISADNANTVSTNVVILSYACIYQGGYLFSFDDTTSNTGNVGGKVTTTSNQAAPFPNGVLWSSNGNGATSGDVDYFNIPGIYNDSVTPCIGLEQGACNSSQILAHYTPTSTYPLNYYAAGTCAVTISTYSDWYLPAVCEMGYAAGGLASGCGTSNTPLLQNIQSNLIELNNLNLLSGHYWSSTEFSGTPSTTSWNHFFSVGAPTQGLYTKEFLFGVRCVRALTL